MSERIPTAIRDADGHIRLAGPRRSADLRHIEVWDFWPKVGKAAVCVCLRCGSTWPEGGSLDICYPRVGLTSE